MLIRKTNPNNMRISVSAEVYGEYNRKKDFKPPVHQKSLEELENIERMLGGSFLFNHLEDKDKRVVALAMKKVEVKNDEFVIK